MRGDGEVQVRPIGAGVCRPCDPEPVSSAKEGNGGVAKDGDALLTEGSRDETSAYDDVVVTEHGISFGALDGFEDLGTTVRGMVCGHKGEGAVGDEVAGEQDEIRGDAVDVPDDALEEEGLGVLVEVYVAELANAKVLEGRGEIADADAVVSDADLVPRHGSGVDGEPRCDGGGAGEEGAPGGMGRGNGRANRHTP